ncbi:hypothetical protein C8T65DRAFT_667148 [Cerioporus squamosus]|nr:hypothetical protein C8T65DRAFT_667148 [Cerioporus squamosus]
MHRRTRRLCRPDKRGDYGRRRRYHISRPRRRDAERDRRDGRGRVRTDVAVETRFWDHSHGMAWLHTSSAERRYGGREGQLGSRSSRFKWAMRRAVISQQGQHEEPENPRNEEQRVDQGRGRGGGKSGGSGTYNVRAGKDQDTTWLPPAHDGTGARFNGPLETSVRPLGHTNTLESGGVHVQSGVHHEGVRAGVDVAPADASIMHGP